MQYFPMANPQRAAAKFVAAEAAAAVAARDQFVMAVSGGRTPSRGTVNGLTRSTLPGVDAPGKSAQRLLRPDARHGSRLRAVHCRLVSRGSKRSRRSTLPFTLNMRRVSLYCSIPPTDLVNPLLTFRFDFLRNKSGRIWHCRIPITEIGEARYYAYSVSGETAPQLHSFDPQKVLARPVCEMHFLSTRF